MGWKNSAPFSAQLQMLVASQVNAYLLQLGLRPIKPLHLIKHFGPANHGKTSRLSLTASEQFA